MKLTIRHKTGTKYGVGFVSVEAGRRIELLYTDLQCDRMKMRRKINGTSFQPASYGTESGT